MQGFKSASVGRQGLCRSDSSADVALNKDLVAGCIEDNVSLCVFGGNAVFLGDEFGLVAIPATYVLVD